MTQKNILCEEEMRNAVQWNHLLSTCLQNAIHPVAHFSAYQKFKSPDLEQEGNTDLTVYRLYIRKEFTLYAYYFAATLLEYDMTLFYELVFIIASVIHCTPTFRETKDQGVRSMNSLPGSLSFAMSSSPAKTLRGMPDTPPKNHPSILAAINVVAYNLDFNPY